MSFLVSTTAAHSTIPHPMATGRPESSELALKIMAAVFATIVFGLIAIIVVWSQWRLRVARRQASLQSEAGEKESSDYDDDETLEDEESIQGIPELAHKTKTIPSQRSKDYDHKLAVLLATIKFMEQREARMARNAQQQKLPLFPRPGCPPRSPSWRQGNAPITLPAPIRPSEWNRYVPRNPSPLGPGVRRGPGPIRQAPWRRFGHSTTSNAKYLLRYASSPRPIRQAYLTMGTMLSLPHLQPNGSATH